jgi:hypothetical protein
MRRSGDDGRVVGLEFNIRRLFFNESLRHFGPPGGGALVRLSAR